MHDEFGPDIEVETHIEPMEVAQLGGQDASPATRSAIGATLAAGAAETGVIKEVHNVRVRGTSAGLVVNYHCRVDPALDVAAVHAQVDRIERATRAAHPDIVRVVGHTEPVRPAARA
jgi:divalent metal cation (Fe/Co/Zn/Cd) transporter